jgi:hypothetical protein
MMGAREVGARRGGLTRRREGWPGRNLVVCGLSFEGDHSPTGQARHVAI